MQNKLKELVPLFHQPLKDIIYGTLNLSETCLKVSQSPVVQRLKYISQLGYVGNRLPFISRYEHSLGVAHLSRLAGESLAKNCPEYQITEREITRLELAGLLHDTGHGLFSHTFDYEFLPQTKYANHPYHFHEKRSLYLIPMALQNFPLVDIQWVMHMVEPEDVPCPDEARSFLGQIVANKVHGMDTDKLDYLARDVAHLQLKKYEPMPLCVLTEDQNTVSIVENLKIENNQIVFSHVNKKDIIKKSLLRTWLHHCVYQHPETKLLQKRIAKLIPDSLAKSIINPTQFVKHNDLEILNMQQPLPEYTKEISPLKKSQNPLQMLPLIVFDDHVSIDIELLEKLLP